MQIALRHFLIDDNAGTTMRWLQIWGVASSTFTTRDDHYSLTPTDSAASNFFVSFRFLSQRKVRDRRGDPRNLKLVHLLISPD
jgi:hypothetical protein